MVVISLLVVSMGGPWPVVRAFYGLHPVRRQEGPLLFHLMGVPGPWSVPNLACALCAVKKGPVYFI